MNKTIYLIQPTYRAHTGTLLQGTTLVTHSCAIPALVASIPTDWEHETCLEFFEDINYDSDASVVAISSMAYDILHGREIADAFRRLGKTVIYGGYQAHFSRDILGDVTDSIVYGYPGPRAMARILGDAQAGCLEPEYEAGIDINYAFDYSILLRHRIAAMPILASVGCRHHCGFCSTAARHKGHYRLRRIRHVLTDLQAIRDHRRLFFLVDSNAYNNRSYLITLCDEIARTGTRFLWAAEATIDIGQDDEALHALRKAGCRVLYIGFESLNQHSLHAVNKPYDTAAYAPAIKRIQQHGIAVAGFFIVGLEGDTAETFDELFDFIRSTRINLLILNILLPVPGTAVFSRLDQDGRLMVNTLEDYLKNALFYGSSTSRCFFRPAGLTANELENGLNDLRLRLASVRETVRRSLFRDPTVATVLLLGNVRFRQDSRRIAAAWQATQLDNSAWASDKVQSRAR